LEKYFHKGPVGLKFGIAGVVSQKLSTTVKLPAELYPFLQVLIFPKVSGFVEKMYVDRGSWVYRGQLLALLSAPEMIAQRARSEAKESADRDTFKRMKIASKTPGAVDKNALERAEQTYRQDAQQVRALKTLEGYLRVVAPFNGVITTRNVHPGAFVGPTSGPANPPMLSLADVKHLRLTVPVPEALVGGIAKGERVLFSVAAWPARTFIGIINRVAHEVDRNTRTMPIEADVYQSGEDLAPGMFVEVLWPVHENEASKFVPRAAIFQVSQGTFLDVVRGSRIEWVNVKRGMTMGNLVQVFGELKAQDLLLAKGSGDLTNGMRVNVRLFQTK